MAKSKERVINQGVEFSFRAYGSGLEEGTTYTACLYYNANTVGYRQTTDDTCRLATADTCRLATAVVNGNEIERPTCVFTFTPEQTLALKVGNAILEIYDTTTKKQMFYDDNYATVRKTSLTPTNE